MAETEPMTVAEAVQIIRNVLKGQMPSGEDFLRAYNCVRDVIAVLRTQTFGAPQFAGAEDLDGPLAPVPTIRANLAKLLDQLEARATHAEILLAASHAHAPEIVEVDEAEAEGAEVVDCLDLDETVMAVGIPSISAELLNSSWKDSLPWLLAIHSLLFSEH